MDLLIDVLGTVEFLAGASSELVSEFAAAGRVTRLGKGHVVCAAGARVEAIVIALSGELAELGGDGQGRGICYAFFETGECAGLESVVDGLPAAREVRVLRSGAFFVVGESAFARFVERHPQVRERVTALLGRRVHARIDERDSDVFLRVPARVARFALTRACVRLGDGARILARESQPQIANRLGSVREVVAREMAAFAADGLLARTRHGLFARDWAGLWHVAGCDLDAACTCAREFARLRTQRFFLPVLAGGPERVAAEARVCGEFHDDLRGCATLGCPLACAAVAASASGVGTGAGARAATAATTGAGSVGNGAAARADAASARAADAPRVASREGAPPPRAARRRERSSRCLHEALPTRRRATPDPFDRSPFESQEISRRVRLYQRRVDAIEHAFHSEDDVPSDASLFDEEPRPHV